MTVKRMLALQIHREIDLTQCYSYVPIAMNSHIVRTRFILQLV